MTNMVNNGNKPMLSVKAVAVELIQPEVSRLKVSTSVASAEEVVPVEVLVVSLNSCLVVAVVVAHQAVILLVVSAVSVVEIMRLIPVKCRPLYPSTCILLCWEVK